MIGIEPTTVYPTSGRVDDLRLAGNYAVSLGSPAIGSPALGSPASSPNKPDEVLRRQAEWEREIENLDQKEMELHQSQLRLIREQTAIFIHDLAVLQQEVGLLRTGTGERLEALERAVGDSGKQHAREWGDAQDKLENLHGRLTNHHGLLHEREAQHQTLLSRVDHLETILGEHAGFQVAFAKDLEASKAAQAKFAFDARNADAHHASFSERVDFLERALGETADKHVQSLKHAHERMEELHGRVTACEGHGSALDGLRRAHTDRDAQHATVVERLDFLERSIGDSAGMHAQQLQSLGDAHGKHAQLLQSLNDAHGKHAQQLQAAHGRLEQLHAQLAEQRGNLDDRGSQHATLRDRVDYLEQTLGESINRNTRELEATKAAHSKLAGEHSVRDQAREADHATLAQRLSFLEKALGESADKQAQELELAKGRLEQAHGKLGEHHQQLLHHSTLQERVKFLEKLIGDSVDKHSETLAEAQSQIEHLRGRLLACEAHGTTIENLRKAHGGLTSDKAKRDAQHASMAERLEHLEQEFERTVEKHTRDLAGAQAGQEQLHGRLAFCERHGATLAELQKAHSTLSGEKASLEHGHSSLQTRLELLEKMHEETRDRHSKEFEALKMTHTKLTTEVKTRDGSNSVVADRLERLEGHLSSTSDKHGQDLLEALSKLDHLHGRVMACEQHGQAIDGLKKAHSSLANDRAARDAHHATLAERLSYLEQLLGDSADQHSQGIKATQGQLEQLQAKIAEERSARETHHASISEQLLRHGESHRQLQSTFQERLSYLESMIGESADTHKRQLEDTKAAHSRLSNEIKAREAHHASVAERLDALEAQLGTTVNSHSKHASDLAAAHAKIDQLHGRLSEHKAVQDEQMRGIATNQRDSRDAHHAGVIERLTYLERLLGESAEQHSRELDAKLSKESKSRDAKHASLVDRLEQLERALGDHSEKHSREVQAKHDHLDRRLQSCEQNASVAVVPESSPAERAKVKELDRHHATLKERVDFLESSLGDNLDRHLRDVESLKGAHSKMSNENKAREAFHSSLNERLDYVEKLLGDSDNKHQHELKAAHGKIEQLHGRLAACEDHGGVIEQLKRSHVGLVNDKAARDAHHASMAERLEWLEKLLGSSADRQSQVLLGRVTPLTERLDVLERLLGETDQKHAQGNQALAATVESLRQSHAGLAKDRNVRDAHHASVADRLDYLEKLLGDSAEKHAKELAAAHARVDQLHGALKEERQAREVHHSSVDGMLAKEREGRGHHQASLEERLRLMEGLVSEASDKVKEVRERVAGEAQLRQQHHDAIAEHLTREQRAREAHEKAMQGHLGGERKAREGHERLVQEMFGHEKNARDRHLAHVQEQLGREREAREKHAEQHQDLLGRHKVATEAAHKELFELVQREKATREQHHAAQGEHLQRERAARSGMEELMNQERSERVRHHEAANERVDSLQRTLGIFDSLIRKEMEERARENRRIWDAIDNHTHDLSTQVITEKNLDVVGTESPLPRLRRNNSAGQVFALPSPVGTVQMSPMVEPVVRLPANGAAVRAPSPAGASPSYGGALATAPLLQQVVPAHAALAPTVRTVQSLPEPERRIDRVERINCGHTRYLGERHSAAEVIMD